MVEIHETNVDLELVSAIKDKFKDDTTDSTLSFIEDVSDTINDLESKASGEQNWKQKYEDNDKQWREKYKERFFSGAPAKKEEQEEEQDPEEKVPGYRDDGTQIQWQRRLLYRRLMRLQWTSLM